MGHKKHNIRKMQLIQSTKSEREKLDETIKVIIFFCIILCHATFLVTENPYTLKKQFLFAYVVKWSSLLYSCKIYSKKNLFKTLSS